MLVTLNKNNFEEEVTKASKPVVVDFWASWCGPCQMLSPIIDNLAAEYEGKLKFCKVNVDEEAELAAANAIVSIPTIIIFKNGKVVERLVGARSQDEFEDILDNYI